jgi:hypothetical protein
MRSGARDGGLLMKRPVRFFNTIGSCTPDDHYMLPPADRFAGAQLYRYSGIIGRYGTVGGVLILIKRTGSSGLVRQE